MVRWVSVAAAVWLGGCGEKGKEPAVEVLSSPADVAAVDRAPEATAEVAPTITVSNELKAKLIELAVVGECARREAVPTEQAIPRLEALFATHGVTLAEYSDAMAQLEGDAELHRAIAARLGSCAGLVEALWPRLVADATVAADADTSAGDAGIQQDAGADAGAAPEVEAEPDAGRVVQGDVQDAAQADTRGTTGVADTVGPRDAEDKPDTKVEPKPTPSWSGTWVGPLKGGPGGNLRVTVSGGLVTGAVATFGRSTLRLKGSLSDKGFLSLGGTAGDEFMRLSGRADRAGQLITGTWDGVVARKRSSGTFRLSR